MRFEKAMQTLFPGDTAYGGEFIGGACHSDRAACIASLKRIHGLPVPASQVTAERTWYAGSFQTPSVRQNSMISAARATSAWLR